MNNLKNIITNKNKLEDKLKFQFKRKFIGMCSRATVAIYATLFSLKQKGYVIVPSNICPSVINVIYQTGFMPVFVDLNLNNFNICRSSLKKILVNYKNVKAIIVPHFYGIPSEIENLSNTIKNHDSKILIIEDVAQAFGVKTKNNLLGTFGDISVFSFGYSKIIDIGTGGAYMTDDAQLYHKIKDIICNLAFKKNNLDNLKKNYRSRYMTILQNKNVDDNLLKIGEDLKELFIHKCNNNFTENLLYEIKNFSKNKSQRLLKYKIYKQNLNLKKIHLPTFEEGSIPWRFVFLSKKSKEITILLRKNNINVSNWYPPIHLYYKDFDIKTDLKNSIKLGEEIINLWLDRNTCVSEIHKTIDMINKII